MHRKAITVTPDRVKRMKTVMLTPFSMMDRFRIGDHWHTADDFASGQAVEEVSHFGRHTTAVGDTMNLHTVEGQTVANVLITDITMRHTDTLTTADLEALGYSSFDEYMSDWGEAVAGKVWFMRIQHLDTVHEGKHAN